MRRIRTPGPNPTGLCLCGCGVPTSVATQGSRRTGNVMGTPLKFLKGHSYRSPLHRAGPNPEGFCLCGCGNKTPISKLTVLSKGLVAGMHARFVQGHANRKGAKNSAWRGGKNHTLQGYILVHNPEHPNATKAGYVPEHRLVVEEVIGRFLRAEEVVHHTNEDKKDNRKGNLVLLAGNREHRLVHKLMDYRRKLRVAIQDENEEAVLLLTNKILRGSVDPLFMVTLSSCLRQLGSAWQIPEPVQLELKRLAGECYAAVGAA